jgi:hypothetical protein
MLRRWHVNGVWWIGSVAAIHMLTGGSRLLFLRRADSLQSVLRSAAVGAALGLILWLLLRHGTNRAGWLIVAGALGAAAANVVSGWALLATKDVFFEPGTNDQILTMVASAALASFCVGVAGGLVSGLVTGSVLAALLSAPTEAADSMSIGHAIGHRAAQE